MPTTDLSKLVKSIDLLSARIADIEGSMLERTDGMYIRNELSGMEKHLAVTAHKFTQLSGEVTVIKNQMATKKDLEGLATKDELQIIRQQMATKEDLKNLVTKDELQIIRKFVSIRYPYLMQ